MARIWIAWMAALAVCGLGLAACGSPEQGGGAPAAPSKPQTAAKPAPEPAPAPTPPPVAPKPTPAPQPTQPAAMAGGGSGSVGYACVDGDAAAGQAQYAIYCATCHGAGGDGEGPAAAGLNPKPAKHTDGAYMNALSNEHLTKVIKEGGPAVGKSPLMAPWGGVLSDDQVGDVVVFMRSLAKPAYACP